MRLSREGALILLIGGADLATTVWFMQTHGAAEANPIMRYFLARGVAGFAVAKAVFCLVPVLFLEWARQHRPVFVRKALRLAILAYLAAYAVGSLGVNKAPNSLLYAESEPGTLSADIRDPDLPPPSQKLTVSDLYHPTGHRLGQ